MGWVAGYLSMACGLGITICVQSSSITTSAITPLVGVGVIKLERMYPVVLGANIGTCLTGVLAALAADGSKLALTLQVAYCHLFFNLSGICLFYVIWPLRALPIKASRFLGNTTAEYKWFAPFYLFMCFFLIPLIFFGISTARPPASRSVSSAFSSSSSSSSSTRCRRASRTSRPFSRTGASSPSRCAARADGPHPLPAAEQRLLRTNGESLLQVDGWWLAGGSRHCLNTACSQVSKQSERRAPSPPV